MSVVTVEAGAFGPGMSRAYVLATFSLPKLDPAETCDVCVDEISRSRVL